MGRSKINVSDLGMQSTSKINEDEIRVVYERQANWGEYLKGYGKNVLVIAGDTYDKDQAKVALLMAQGKIKEQLDLRVYNKENKAVVLFDENGNGKVDMEDARTVYEKAKGRAMYIPAV